MRRVIESAMRFRSHVRPCTLKHMRIECAHIKTNYTGQITPHHLYYHLEQFSVYIHQNVHVFLICVRIQSLRHFHCFVSITILHLNLFVLWDCLVLYDAFAS